MKLGKFELDQIYCGDSKELMEDIPSNKVDLIVTDPPYGIAFMGKKWDTFKPKGAYQYKKGFKQLPRHSTNAMMEFFVPIWKECLRILKSGSFAFIMCSPRQDVLMKQIQALIEAGFNTGFTSIYWTYASGFPKASNIGKMVDKKPKRLLAGKMRDKLNEYRTKAGLSIKQINEYFGFATTGSGVAHHWMTHPTQPTIPTQEQYQKLKKLLKIENLSLDELYIEAKREITGKDKNWGKKGSTPLTGYKEFERKDKPVTPQAKSLNGSYAGFQPKPAVEVIIVAMKPLSEKTYVDQALKNRKGITWLDDGRIPYESEDDKPNDIKNQTVPQTIYGGGKGLMRGSWQPKQGRFPANLLVSDDVLNDGKIRKSTPCKNHTGSGKGKDGSNPFTQSRGGKVVSRYIGEGSYSRYFDLDKWAVSQGVKDTFPFLIVPKASKSEKNKGCENLDKGEVKHYTKNRRCKKCGHQQVSGSPCKCENPEWEIIERPVMKGGNIHPTVKPIKLMSYLIMLGSREGDIILDNFCGSGSTLVSAKKLNRHFLGFDTEMEYVKISKARLSAIKHIQERLL